MAHTTTVKINIEREAILDLARTIQTYINTYAEKSWEDLERRLDVLIRVLENPDTL